jgi:hypothetical protein
MKGDVLDCGVGAEADGEIGDLQERGWSGVHRLNVCEVWGAEVGFLRGRRGGIAGENNFRSDETRGGLAALSG